MSVQLVPLFFGTREELLAEAKRRLSLLRGTEYDYPRQSVNSTDKYRATVPAYQYHIYGEKEGGGTQVLALSGVPFTNLGLPDLDEVATGSSCGAFTTLLVSRFSIAISRTCRFNLYDLQKYAWR